MTTLVEFSPALVTELGRILQSYDCVTKFGDELVERNYIISTELRLLCQKHKKADLASAIIRVLMDRPTSYPQRHVYAESLVRFTEGNVSVAAADEMRAKIWKTELSNLSSLPWGVTISWLAQELLLDDVSRIQLFFQKIDGNFLCHQYNRGFMIETFQADPFNLSYETSARIFSIVEQALKHCKMIPLFPRLRDVTGVVEREHMALVIANCKQSNVDCFSVCVSVFRNKINWSFPPKHLPLKTEENNLTKFDQARLAFSMLMSDAPQTTMAQLRTLLQESGLHDLSKNSIFSDSPKNDIQGFPENIIEMHNALAVSAVSAPLLQTMDQRNAIQKMHAAHLLRQTGDADLEDLVSQLWSALRKDEAWYKYATVMGATASDEAKTFIKEARAGGRPERAVISQISLKTGYTALSFLADLKKLGIAPLNNCVEAIESYLACKESATLSKTTEASSNEDVLRQWIIGHRLCNTDSQVEIDSYIQGLKKFGAHTLEDLEIMDKNDFVDCGFPGLSAKKAEKASKTIPKK